MPTLNLQVGASSDDAYEVGAAGIPDLTGVQLRSGSPATSSTGMRFTNVTIPQGATIDSAILQILTYNTSVDDANLNIYAEATDNAGTFTSSDGDVDARSLTSASVSWVQASLGTGWQSKSITAIVQEIVNRGGWSSGNAIAVLTRTAQTDSLFFRSYDFDPASAPKLDITYTEAGGAVPIIMQQHHAMGWR